MSSGTTSSLLSARAPEHALPSTFATPRGLPLLGHLPVVLNLLGSARRLRELGDIVKLRLPPYDVFILNQPRDIEQLLVQEHERFQKDWTTRLLKEVLGQGLVVNEGASWRKQRRIIQPELTPRRVDTQVTSMVACVAQALPGFAARGAQEPHLDLHAEMIRLMLDVAGRTLFGTDTEQVATEIGAILEQFMVHFLGFFGTTLRFPDWVPTPGNRRARANLARLRAIVANVIAARRVDSTQGNDLLSRMIAVRDEDGKPMPDSLLSDEAVTMLLAGHETTALLLTFALMLISQDPEVEQKLLSELREQQVGAQPSAAELARLPYLDAVLRETLRLYPPVYSIGREALEDTQIGGCTIPRGAQVWLFQWSVHRDARFYEQPEQFRPERWLAPEIAQLPRFAYFPFGGGPRICPGAHFSLVEAKVVLAMLLPRFSFDLLHKGRPRLAPSVTIRPKGGLLARVRPR